LSSRLISFHGLKRGQAINTGATDWSLLRRSFVDTGVAGAAGVRRNRSRQASIWAWIAVAAILVSVTRAAEAQQDRRPYRIGVVNDAASVSHPTVEGLKAGLKELGLEEDRDVTFDIRFTKGDAQAARAQAASLVTEGVDLFFTSHEGSTQAVKDVTQSIPIIFTLVGNPVAANLLASTLWETSTAARLSRPGANLTGISSLGTELAAKRLETLKRLIPTLRRVWAIYHATDPSALAAVLRAQETAPLVQLTLIAKPVFSAEQVVQVLRDVKPGDAVLAPDSDALGIPAIILEVSLSSRVPAIFPTAVWVAQGGLVSYGPDYYAQGIQAARLVVKILRGTQPQDLPVEGADRIELVVNLKTAAFLGVKVPSKVLLRADRLER
jgi:putative tryptophan/tyrosine transport system substrate-binding protein